MICKKIGLAVVGLLCVGMHAWGFQYYSQSHQDRYVHEHYFKNKANGIFVEIGAYDGVKYSNTYFFEKQLGWKGICVEPIPSMFAQLITNRNCICIQGCISNVAGKSQFLEVVGAPQMLSGLVEKYDPRHVDRIHHEIDRDGGALQVIDVDCFTVADILKSNAIEHVDYLSIDTEGNEFEILKSIDFDMIDIDIITVEDNYGDQQITRWMAMHGYVCDAKLGGDLVFRKNK